MPLRTGAALPTTTSPASSTSAFKPPPNDQTFHSQIPPPPQATVLVCEQEVGLSSTSDPLLILAYPYSAKMGDILVENPANHISPLKKATPSTIPSIENFEGIGTDTGDEYASLKKLQRQLEYIQLQEEYIKDEQRSLKRELVRAQEEIKRIQSVPLVIGQFMEAIDQK